MFYLNTRFARLCGVAAFSLTYESTFAHEAEFDENLLHRPAGVHIDTEQFRYGNPIAAGEYLADIYINKKFHVKQLIKFEKSKQTDTNNLCWSENLRSLLNIQPSNIHLPDTQNSCAFAAEVTPDLSYKFDIASQRLDISIPQALLISKTDDDFSHLWQNSVPVGFVRYQFHQHRHHSPKHKTDSKFLGLQAGASAGRWSFYHQGGLAWRQNQRQQYQDYATYLQTDLDKIQSRLTIGDSNTQSTILDNLRLQGVFIASDRRMLPKSEQGYTPEISGHANTHAVIRISQKGVVIYEKSVAPGPFVVNDLYSFSANGGDITIEVIEEDGTIHTQILPIFKTSNLLRPKQLFYQAAIGYHKQGDKLSKQPLLHASATYGINNHLTLQTGIIAHKNHQLFSGGAVIGSPVGVFSGSMRLTQSKNLNKPLLDKAQIGFSQYFINTKTQLNADISHYFHRNNTHLSSLTLDNQAHRSDDNDLKNQYRISIAQNLGLNRGGLTVSGVLNHYWQKPDDYSYRIGYGNAFKGVQYQFGVLANINQRSQNNPTFYINASIPFGSTKKPLSKRVQSSINYSQQGQVNYKRFAINQNFGNLNQHQYSMSISQRNSQSPTISAAVHTTMPQAKINALATKTGRQMQYSYGISGAIVAHQHGVILNHELSQTFGIIQAKGATGTPILNGRGSKINRWGYGIVGTLTPYQKNHIGIDARHIPDNISLDATSKQVIPRANTAQLVKLSAKSGHLILLDITNQAKQPPFGAIAQDSQATTVGYITPDHRLLLHSAKPADKITVSWNQGDLVYRCHIEYQLDSEQQKKQSLQILPATCQ